MAPVITACQAHVTPASFDIRFCSHSRPCSPDPGYAGQDRSGEVTVESGCMRSDQRCEGPSGVVDYLFIRLAHCLRSLSTFGDITIRQ